MAVVIAAFFFFNNNHQECLVVFCSGMHTKKDRCDKAEKRRLHLQWQKNLIIVVFLFIIVITTTSTATPKTIYIVIGNDDE
mmetsp:Transcript_42062/g.61886  ORF Transcript_42062/g.61886 Transcript_42062/m.61886 type:complete len:81 (+) Transcript_42062:126-368(+)